MDRILTDTMIIILFPSEFMSFWVLQTFWESSGGQRRFLRPWEAISTNPDKIWPQKWPHPESGQISKILGEAVSNPDKNGYLPSGQKPQFLDTAFSAIARGPPILQLNQGTVQCQ